MKRRTKIILLAFFVIIIAGSVVVWRIWNKPHRDVAYEKAIPVSAAALVKAYDDNEHMADSAYLDKAVEVQGVVNTCGVNQDSFPTLTLQSDNLMRSVYCTLKKTEKLPVTGNRVTVKGICKGNLSDVIVTDAIIK